MKLIKSLLAIVMLALVIQGCKKDKTDPNADGFNHVAIDSTTTGPKLIFKFKFDSTQTRLDNFGNVAVMPSGHAGQNPVFNVMSAHYAELAQTAYTALGAGDVLFKAYETKTGGDNAIDFDKSLKVADGGSFLEMPLSKVTPGTYQYLRVSLAYQNYNIKMYIENYGGYVIQRSFPCTLASFVGFNTYINNYNIKTSNQAINGNKAQGYWGFETDMSSYPGIANYVSTGQAPATTVVNPLHLTSPIPLNSCVETAAFDGGPLTISGHETHDVVVTVSLSTNKSFEWVEVVNDGRWDPSAGEYIVDMGLRGIKPIIQY